MGVVTCLLFCMRFGFDQTGLWWAGLMFVMAGSYCLTARRLYVRRRWGREGRCIKCGYDLTGNVSGRCPECGEAIRGDEKEDGGTAT